MFTDILDNYQSYDFKDNSTYCDIYGSISTQPALFLPQCGIPLAQYVWWNSGQSVCTPSSSSSPDLLADVPDLAPSPSWPVHQILASKIAKASTYSCIVAPAAFRSVRLVSFRCSHYPLCLQALLDNGVASSTGNITNATSATEVSAGAFREMRFVATALLSSLPSERG